MNKLLSKEGFYPANSLDKAIVKEQKRRETYFKKEILIEKKIYTDYELKRMRLIEQQERFLNGLKKYKKNKN